MSPEEDARRQRVPIRTDPSKESGRLTWRQTEVDGAPARYGEAGDGPTVVFLHGWALDHRVYKRALSRLVRAGVRVIAPALPGFGGTAALDRHHVSLSSYGDWTARFLDALGSTEPVVVVGHSFGGGVAICLAHDRPDRVRGLVLVNSIGGSTWTRRGSAMRSMAERPLWDWGLHFGRDLLPTRQARRVIPVIVSEAVPNLLRDPRSFWDAAGLARRADLRVELARLRERQLPVVILWGRSDRLITRHSFEEMCRVLGDPEVVTVEGSHAWLLADPNAFGEVMTNVLEVVGLAGAEGHPRDGEDGRRRAS